MPHSFITEKKNDIQFVLLAGWKKKINPQGKKDIKAHGANTLEGDFHEKKKDFRMVL